MGRQHRPNSPGGEQNVRYETELVLIHPKVISLCDARACFDQDGFRLIENELCARTQLTNRDSASKNLFCPYATYASRYEQISLIFGLTSYLAHWLPQSEWWFNPTASPSANQNTVSKCLFWWRAFSLLKQREKRIKLNSFLTLKNVRAHIHTKFFKVFRGTKVSPGNKDRECGQN